MNWITKIIKAGEKIKTAIKERASKEDIAKSDWTSCCIGPILKKDLESNLWVCPECNKHHRIKPNRDLIFYLVKIIMKYLKLLFQKMIH